MEPLAFKKLQEEEKSPALLNTAIKETKWEEKGHSLSDLNTVEH